MLTISTINYRNWPATAQCIRDLLVACDGLQYRILLRDNSEVSETDQVRAELGDAPAVLYFESPQNPGFGQGHNRNFQAVTHGPDDIFLILNNDIRLPDPGVIRAMLAACRPTRIVSCVILNSANGAIWCAGGKSGRISGDFVMTRDPLRDPWRSTEFVSGCCLMLPAAFYESLGGFDERFFMYVEDLDLCIRARSLGAHVMVVNSSLLHEVGSGQAGQYSNLYLYENTKNRLICLRQHRLGWPGIRIAYFVAKYGGARALQLALFSSKPIEQIGSAWRGLWDGYFHMPACRLADFQKAACGGGLK